MLLLPVRAWASFLMTDCRRVLQSASMPVTQWEYNDLLRLECDPIAPPAEDWRVELHNRSSAKVRCLWPSQGTAKSQACLLGVAS